MHDLLSVNFFSFLHTQGDRHRLAGTASCRTMGSQVPADCCVEEFAFCAARRPLFCLAQAGFENLQTMEVQILANSGESERINQLCLWIAEGQITQRRGVTLQTIPFAGREQKGLFPAVRQPQLGDSLTAAGSAVERQGY